MAQCPRAEAACSGRRRFAVACSVLSQCVRAEMAAAALLSRPVVLQPQAASSPSPMLLMPGADVVSEDTVPTPTTASAQLTIVYGGRVLVLDDVRADRAAEVMRIAIAARQDMPMGGLADLQVARKASLQRVMEKRRERLRTRAPYAPAAGAPAVPKEQREKNADRWLRLGIPG